jgi:hypothetical protein
MAPLLECHTTSGHHLQSFGFFPFGSINLGFLLRENLAAIFIIPSSWGSQLDGALHYQHRAASVNKMSFYGEVTNGKYWLYHALEK